jgi:hypothetical protein
MISKRRRRGYQEGIAADSAFSQMSVRLSLVASVLPGSIFNGMYTMPKCSGGYMLSRLPWNLNPSTPQAQVMLINAIAQLYHSADY